MYITDDLHVIHEWQVSEMKTNKGVFFVIIYPDYDYSTWYGKDNVLMLYDSKQDAQTMVEQLNRDIKARRCDRCKGHGFIEAFVDCKHCDGTGIQEVA